MVILGTENIAMRLKTQNTRLLRLLVGLAGLTCLALPSVAYAQAVTQAYGVTGTLQKGMIVMLDPKDSKKVQALTNKSTSSMHGVVVAAADSAVTLSGDGTTDQVFVATSGKYAALVNTQNGVIKTGDIISISALDGTGMKADNKEAIILGKALEGFDGTKKVIGTTTLSKSDGQKTNVAIGLIALDISISRNPLAATVGNEPALPGFMSRFATTLAGKEVSVTRIYISLAVLFVTVVITGSLLYAGVRSSLTAIGRNPLARGSVIRGLIQVIVISVIIFVIGLSSIYLLLKL
jgi:co-chaperonin GroES (HSP10)